MTIINQSTADPCHTISPVVRYTAAKFSIWVNKGNKTDGLYTGCLPVDSELSAAESPVVVQDISQESSHTLAQPLILKNENVEQKSISRNNRRQTKKQDMGDLLVPDGIEGPTPVFARPGKQFETSARCFIIERASCILGYFQIKAEVARTA